jgi:hypothetical protein
MDDLQVVRELFTERPPPSADVIAAARARLPLSRSRRRRAVLRIGVPVSALTAAAAVITAVAVSGSAAEPGAYQLPAGAHVPAGTTAVAQRILLTAARTVGRAALPATGRYWVARAAVGNFQLAGPAGHHYVILTRVRDQDWAAHSAKAPSPDLVQALGVRLASASDEAAWRRDGSPTTWNIGEDFGLAEPHGFADGFNRATTMAPGKLTDTSVLYGAQFHFGSTFMSASQLLALPADPARLKALLLAGFGAGGADGDISAEAYLFEVAPPVLALPVTPAVRSALYQMLAGLPGVRSLGQVQDAAGQRGLGVALSRSYSGCGDEVVQNRDGASDPARPSFASCVVQQRLVINPETGLPLAQELRYVKLPAGQKWSAPDGLFSYQIFQTAHWTSASPPNPSS